MNYHLRSMPSAQTHVAFVYNECNSLVAIRLYSYSTCILETVRMEKGDIYHWVTNVVFDPAYSRTTARHVNRFTRELFGRNYYLECKEAWANKSPLAEVLYTNSIMNFCNEYHKYGKRLRN
jgi:hypothetical protein